MEQQQATNGAGEASHAPTAAEVAAEAFESGGDPFAEALAKHTPDGEEGTEESGEGTTTEQPKKPAPAKEKTEAAPEDAEKEPEKPKEKKKTRAELEAFLLSKEQTDTPEGRENARVYFRKRAAKLDGIEIRLGEKGAALAADAEAIAAGQRALENDRAYARKLGALRQALEDPSDMAELVTAIGTICNKDGREIWERWTRFALAGGKRAEVGAGEARALAKVSELEAKVGELIQALRDGGQQQEADAAQHEMSQLSQASEQAGTEIITMARDAEKFPALAAYARLPAWREPLLEDFRRIRREARAAGLKLDRAGVLDRLNAALSDEGRPAGAKPVSPAGVTPASPRVAESATTISPSHSRSSTVRDMTQEEREADLMRDVPQLEAWFGPLDR